MGGVNSGGRNAKSVADHKAHGTYRPDRHDGADVPEPPQGRPEPPKALNGDALDEWNRMVGRLEKSNTLSIVDDAALYQYCLLFAETEAIRADNLAVRKLSAELKKAVRKLEGMELVEAIKKIVDLQYVIAKHSTQLRQGHAAIRQFLVEFGQTPSSRTRVKVTKPNKPTSKLVAFRGGRADSPEAAG